MNIINITKAALTFILIVLAYCLNMFMYLETIKWCISMILHIYQYSLWIFSLSFVMIIFFLRVLILFFELITPKILFYPGGKLVTSSNHEAHFLAHTLANTFGVWGSLLYFIYLTFTTVKFSIMNSFVLFITHCAICFGFWLIMTSSYARIMDYLNLKEFTLYGRYRK